MSIAIGSDHAGFELKQAVVEFLRQQGLDVEDVGCHDARSVDYPDIATLVARAVAEGKAERGILICGTGIGMSITANKIPGVRAAVCGDTFSAKASREHNDANVLCLGSRVVGMGLALEIVSAWLQATFSGEERHCRRITKIAALESAGRAS